MITNLATGENKSVSFYLVVSFDITTYYYWCCLISLNAPSVPLQEQPVLSAGVRLEVIEHRDQGATRGQQQQPSSLRGQPPPSLATPGGGEEESQSLLRRM